MGKIIDVKSIVENKKIELKERVEKLKKKKIYPKLAVIIANNEDSSRVYVGKKRKMCEELGIEEIEYILEEKTTNEEICEIINRLNEDNTVSGILVQLPIYKHLDENKILETILPSKDCDGIHPENLGKLLIGRKDGIIACTPKGINMVIDSLGADLTGMNAVVIGRSIIVGKPMSQLLLSKGATVTVCHSKTKDLKSHTKNADIIVVATGVPGLITKGMIKKDSIIIDVGINRVNGKLCGDVDTNNVVKKAKFVTPVPGGIGLTTVISLMDNLIEMSENKVK
jgi:methylenetetrahydrofolate dehydrogenase (NADP+)/methenyltetrahydrofolate cyclohydrolase